MKPNRKTYGPKNFGPGEFGPGNFGPGNFDSTNVATQCTLRYISGVNQIIKSFKTSDLNLEHEVSRSYSLGNTSLSEIQKGLSNVAGSSRKQISSPTI